jgi:Uma2 family endonuclease
MAVQPRIKAADFWEISQHSDFINKPIELIYGEIEEMPSNPRASALASRINFYIFGFVEAHDLGHVSGEGGGYEVDDENIYAPDVAFISKQRQPELPRAGFNPIPPDLAVEVVSPSDLKDPKRRIFKKLKRYQAARVPLVWYVYEERQEVEVYRPDQPMQILGFDDVLEGGSVLLGFRLPLKTIFK